MPCAKAASSGRGNKRGRPLPSEEAASQGSGEAVSKGSSGGASQGSGEAVSKASAEAASEGSGNQKAARSRYRVTGKTTPLFLEVGDPSLWRQHVIKREPLPVEMATQGQPAPKKKPKLEAAMKLELARADAKVSNVQWWKFFMVVLFQDSNCDWQIWAQGHHAWVWVPQT